jgi:hypothetical protein
MLKGMTSTCARRFVVGAAMLPLLGVVAGCGADPSESSRQEEVRDAGVIVMPFDLDMTKHAFVKVDNGGEQTVIALDTTDAEQVRLVREHFKEISVEFAAGNFDDPTMIHGDDMPGLQMLKDHAEELNVVYSEISGGAMITYTATDQELVGAVHDWFDAQLADHGSDAASEPVGDVMTEEMWRQHHPGQPYPGDTTSD